VDGLRECALGNPAINGRSANADEIANLTNPDESPGAEGTDLRRGGSRTLFPAFSDRSQTLDLAPQFPDLMSRGLTVLQKLPERPLTGINPQPFEDIFLKHLPVSRFKYAEGRYSQSTAEHGARPKDFSSLERRQ
jgi:hypothetical protein